MAELQKFNGVRKASKGHTTAAPLWTKMRHVIAGEEAVHGAGVKYLPQLSGQTDPSYAAYKSRAPFYTATGRTLDGLTGLLFGRPPKVDAPAAADPFVKDMTMQGDPLQTFAETVAREVMSVGGGGVLVDFPNTPVEVVTKAQEEALNLRPFARTYPVESVLGFKLGQVNNATALIQVRLLEWVDEPGEDEFSTVEVEQVRVLELVQALAEGSTTTVWQYQQRTFRKVPGKEDWVQHGDAIVPKRSNAPLDFIPFQFFGPRDNGPRISKPPLLDVANLNLHHYRTNADYHHGLHFTGLPTPWLAGFKVDDKTPVSIGSEVFLVAEDPDAKAGYLEFEGQGLSETREELQRLEAQLAALGARMLAPEKLGVEAADAMEIRSRGEQSVMAAIAVSLSLGLTNVLNWMVWWSGVDDMDSSTVELNRDFMPKGITAQTISALLGALNSGNLLQADFIRYLQRADVVDPNEDIEAYITRLQTERPTGLDMGGGFDAKGNPIKPGAKPKGDEPPKA